MAWQQINGIPFSKRDSSDLSKAVNRFNRKLRRLRKKYENEDIMLPDLLSTRELKTNIQDRRDLRNQLKSIERFMRKDSEEIIKLDSGIKMTKYQRYEIRIGIIRAKANLRSRIKDLDKYDTETGNPTIDFARYRLKSDEKTNIERKINSLKNVDKRDRTSLSRLIKRIDLYSSHSRLYQKNVTYKENYIETIKKVFEYTDGLDSFIKQLEDIDPIEFYGIISYNDIASDIKFIYQEAQRISKGVADESIDEYFNDIKSAWVQQ